MTVELCVLLWASEGRERELSEYEDTVLALIPLHGGRVRSRVRRVGLGDGPLEVQVIELPDDDAVAAYLGDPARVALADTHRRVIAQTQVLNVDTIV